jgi:hypothetical protein
MTTKHRAGRGKKRHLTASAKKNLEKLIAKTKNPAKAEALRAALGHAEHAAKIRKRYNRTLNHAIKLHGDVNDGHVISGIYNDGFPEPVKNKLRAHLRELNATTDASLAAYKRSGKRTHWGAVFRHIANPDDSFY